MRLILVVFFITAVACGTAFAWLSSEVMISNNDGAASSAPAMATDSLGNIHMVWKDADGIRYKKVDHFGNYVLAERHLAQTTSLSYFPNICVDQNNIAHIVWCEASAPTGNRQLYYEKIDSSGTSVINHKVITSSAQSNSSPKIAAGPDCLPRITYMQYNPTYSNNNVCYVQLNSNGDPGTPRTLSTSWAPASGPSIAVDASNKSHIIWSQFDGDDTDPNYLIYTKLNADGSTSMGNALISGRVAGYEQWNPSIALDPQGNTFITWAEDYYDGSATSDYSVGFKKFSTSSGIQDILVARKISNSETGYPAISDLHVDPNGNINIVWSNTNDYKIYFEKLNSAGTILTDDHQVGSFTYEYCMPRIAVGINESYVTWDHVNGSVSEIYFQADFPDTTPPGSMFDVNLYKVNSYGPRTWNSPLRGMANDAESGVKKVEVAIYYRQFFGWQMPEAIPAYNYFCWNGTSFIADGGPYTDGYEYVPSIWVGASGTSNWTFAGPPLASLSNEVEYTALCRATDNSNNVGTNYCSYTFSFCTVRPVVSGFLPIAGSVNDIVTVTGDNFVAGATAALGGSPAATTFIGSTEISFYVPSAGLNGQTSYPISVTNPDGLSGTSASGFYLISNVGASYSISGKITSEVGGAGITGVLVSAGTSNATTNSGGLYTITGLASGTYVLSATKEGWAFSPASRSVTITSGSAINQNFIGTPVYSISGVATLEGMSDNSAVTISAVKTTDQTKVYVATSEATGSYSIKNVPAGSYTVSAVKDGWNMTPQNFSNPVVITTANITQKNLHGVALTYSVSGQIVGLPQEELVKGVSVRLASASPQTVLTYNGSFAFSNVERGTHDITPQKIDGYSVTPESISINVSADRSDIVFTYSKIIIESATGAYNHPNPFNPNKGESTIFEFKLAEPTRVGVYIFDLGGRLIWRYERTLTIGQVSWDGHDFLGRASANGVYLVRVVNLDGNKLIGKCKTFVVK